MYFKSFEDALGWWVLFESLLSPARPLTSQSRLFVVICVEILLLVTIGYPDRHLGPPFNSSQHVVNHSFWSLSCLFELRKFFIWIFGVTTTQLVQYGRADISFDNLTLSQGIRLICLALVPILERISRFLQTKLVVFGLRWGRSAQFAARSSYIWLKRLGKVNWRQQIPIPFGFCNWSQWGICAYIRTQILDRIFSIQWRHFWRFQFLILSRLWIDNPYCWRGVVVWFQSGQPWMILWGSTWFFLSRSRTFTVNKWAARAL